MADPTGDRIWGLSFRRDWGLLLAAICAGVFFFLSLGKVWPLLEIDLNARREALDLTAREVLATRGFDASAHAAASELVIYESTLDFLERSFGWQQTQTWAREGLPFVGYRVYLRRAGTVDWYEVTLTPEGRPLSWWRSLEEDEPAPEATLDEARAAALAELESLGLDPAAWREAGVAERQRPFRTDRTFTYERIVAEEPNLRDRMIVTVSGPQVTAAQRALVPPAAWYRTDRAQQAGPTALFNIGVILMSVAIVAAFFVFLLRLRAGTARLLLPAVWAAVVFACVFATRLLADADLLSNWDTLVPWWISTSSYLVRSLQGQVWMLLILLTVTSAADALDREMGAHRGEALWLLGSGKVRDPRVGAAVTRGFLVGLLCGATLVGSVLVITAATGGTVALQPRGFFFFGINSILPSASILFFFVNVALLEELGYRFFCGTWLMKLTGRKWIAIVLPAIVYGLTHAPLDFLPPAQPFWGRTVVMALVGCVWGWAFFRYGALTVVISHLMSDLFIFNWPRLASGDPWTTGAALATFGAPLLLALPSLIAPRRADPDEVLGAEIGDEAPAPVQ